jgi:hypothetical protein
VYFVGWLYTMTRKLSVSLCVFVRRFISTSRHCAFNQVDDESLELAIEACRTAAEEGDLQSAVRDGRNSQYPGRTGRATSKKALNGSNGASIQGHPGHSINSV